MRLHDWPHLRDGAPALGDLVFEEPAELERGFVVVGVEERSRPDLWTLHLERLEWSDWLARSGRSWGFIRDR